MSIKKIISKGVGFISQLFSIINDNKNFCLLETKILNCNKWNKEFSTFSSYRKSLIPISSTELEYDDISTIFLDKKLTDANELFLDYSEEKFKYIRCLYRI